MAECKQGLGIQKEFALKKYLMSLVALAFTVVATSISVAALAQSAPPAPQASQMFGTLTEDAAVTIKNEGGKMLILQTLENWSKSDWKVARLEKGETCLLKKDTPVYRDGDATANTVTVRAITVAAEPGECPLGAKFEIAASKIAWGTIDGTEKSEGEEKKQ